MSKTLVTLALMCASLHAQVTRASIAASAEPSVQSSAPAVNPVIEWNRTLLVIVRTSGAQPATIRRAASLFCTLLSTIPSTTSLDSSLPI
jgi:hypothetical protein